MLFCTCLKAFWICNKIVKNISLVIPIQIVMLQDGERDVFFSCQVSRIAGQKRRGNLENDESLYQTVTSQEWMTSSVKNDEANWINDGHNWACPVGHVTRLSFQSPSFIQELFVIRRLLRKSYMLVFKFVVFSVYSIQIRHSFSLL